jgi:phosphoglycolate phosphatase-like HAD superfamily hydrolase
MAVLLFDIDGTLYHGHGVGRDGVETALASCLGRAVDTAGVDFSGRTDPQIFRAILADTARVGPIDGHFPDVLAEALDAYHADMLVRLPGAPATAIPGAAEAVRRLHGSGVPTGLLTGNLEPLAYLKVEAVGLERALFPFGAYGSDDESRDALPAVAAERASAVLGRPVATRELVVVGDTPLDVACARAAGAVAVAVTTGRFSAADLAHADLVLDSLDGLTEDVLGRLVPA